MNNNNLLELHSCTPSTMQPCNFDAKKCNSSNNFSATPSLQVLAAAVLERNRLRNSNATSQKEAYNFHATFEEKEFSNANIPYNTLNNALIENAAKSHQLSEKLHSCIAYRVQLCNFSPEATPSLNLNATFTTPELQRDATNEKVMCGDCLHFKPDTIGDGSGLGACAAIPNKQIFPLPFPHALRECSKFQKKII